MMEIKRDGTMFYCGDSKNPLAKITFYYQDNLMVNCKLKLNKK